MAISDLNLQKNLAEEQLAVDSQVKKSANERLNLELASKEQESKKRNWFTNRLRSFLTDWQYKIISILIALIVGLGEALVAVYFMNALTLSGMLLIGIPALLVNFLLFRADTFNFLKAFGDKKLFKDRRLNPFTGKTKAILIFTMGLALFAGLSSAFLQLNSILATFGSVFWGITSVIALTAPPLSLMLTAISVAAISAIANTALLYANVEKFIKYKEYNNYINVFKDIFGLNKDKSKRMAIGWRIYHGVFALFGLVCAVSIYFITLGMFQAQAFAFFNGFVKFSAKTSSILTYIIVHASGQLLNGFFYMRGMLKSIELFGIFIKNVFICASKVAYRFFANKPDSKVTPKIKPVAAVDDKLDNPSVGAKMWAITKFFTSIAVFFGIFYCCLKNGIAQGNGAMNEPRSIGWLEKVLPKSVCPDVAKMIMATASTSVNALAAFDEIAPSEETVKTVKKVVSSVTNVFRLSNNRNNKPPKKVEIQKKNQAQVVVDKVEAKPLLRRRK